MAKDAVTKAVEQVTDVKISANLWQLLAAGAIKPYTERFLTPYVGNGNLVSGAAKIVIGTYAAKFLPKEVRSIVQVALVLDGAEDIVTQVAGGFLPQNTGGSDSLKIM